MAKLLRAGHDIILQMNYATNGTEAVDHTQVGIIFAREPPKQATARSFPFAAYRFVMAPFW